MIPKPIAHPLLPEEVGSDPNAYDPVESLRKEVDRFNATNQFNPMQVTNFYLQAACVLTELKRALEENARLHREVKNLRRQVDNLETDPGRPHANGQPLGPKTINAQELDKAISREIEGCDRLIPTLDNPATMTRHFILQGHRAGLLWVRGWLDRECECEQQRKENMTDQERQLMALDLLLAHIVESIEQVTPPVDQDGKLRAAYDHWRKAINHPVADGMNDAGDQMGGL